MSNKRKPHVIVLRLAAVLMILVMLSTSMVAGRYARYATTGSASDSARVAKFLITQTGSLMEQSVPVQMVPGQTVDLDVVVTNGSEVAVEYSIAAENKYTNLPLVITLLDDEENEVTAVVLAPGEEKTLECKIYWDENKTLDEYIGMVDLIHLTIQTTQID